MVSVRRLQAGIKDVMVRANVISVLLIHLASDACHIVQQLLVFKLVGHLAFFRSN